MELKFRARPLKLLNSTAWFDVDILSMSLPYVYLAGRMETTVPNFVFLPVSDSKHSTDRLQSSTVEIQTVNLNRPLQHV